MLETLDELRTITTHDDNLERQYKEGGSEREKELLETFPTGTPINNLLSRHIFSGIRECTAELSTGEGSK